ncbi:MULTISPECIES: helix-turn-helix transcriptional regulator [unclassified Microcoleus]|uniref:helix-turn-helix transcriptional regulator n=1 Tax=unclassified Microcoleus TaxID=2642155 RepID=UPI002FD40A32
MYECKITLGKTVKNARQEHGFSQQDLCKLLIVPSDSFQTIDRCLLAKIENNRVDVRSPEYDWLILRIAAIFALDVVWLEAIRQQTEVEPLDLENAVAVFPIYFNRKTYDL